SHGPPRDRPALYKPLGSRHHSLRILASVTLVGFREVGEFAVFFPFHRSYFSILRFFLFLLEISRVRS
ncbi:unnamed protein product, partial [Musa textilis]